MERKFTFRKNFLHNALLFSLVLVGLLTTQFAMAHNVTGYTASCATGPLYKVDPVVNSTNSGSNYAWQYKNSAGSWVCIVNGNNAINGNNYSVSGATSTATTNPAPIIFNNPNSALQGLVIRCVISDGNGVNPCSMPSGNTWNSGSGSVNHTVAVNNTPCAPANVLQLGNRVWYDVNNNGVNSSEDGIAGLVVRLYKDDNNDNNADGSAIATDITDDDGYYSFTNLAPGNYIVGVVTPAGYMSSTTNGGDPDNNINFDDNGQVTVGDETRGLAITLSIGNEPDGNNNNTNNNITYDFGFLPDCSCTASTSNLLVNGSFENGTTGWSSSNSTFSTGTGYVACGTKNGFNDWNTGTSIVYQEVNVTPGTSLVFKGFAGTHTPGQGCSPKLSLVFYNGTTKLTQSDVVVDRDVDKNHNQLKQYTIAATVPANATKVRVQSSITCDYMKLDAFCLTATNNVLQLGTRVWYDTNNDGLDNNSEDGISKAIVRLYKDDNNDNVADGASIATDTTDINGYYKFYNLYPGNYIVGVVRPSGYMASAISGGDPDNNTNFDNNGQVTVGNETRGLAITLAIGTEPEGDAKEVNSSYDFGFLPDCSCTSSNNNKLVNSSFENGTTGWSVGNSNFTTGTGYVACGTKNGFNDATGNGTAYVFQEFTAYPGTTYTFKGFAGTHTAGLGCSPRLVMTFRNASGGNITEFVVPVTRDVDVNHNQLEQYTIVGTAPAGTVTMRVHGAIDCNTLKMDAFCLTSTCVAPATPKATVTQTICGSATKATVVLSGLPTGGNWTIDQTGTSSATYSGSGASKVITNLAAGTYNFTVTYNGCTSAAVAVTIGNPSATLSLGGFVWEDKNKNGFDDDGSLAVSNVVVNLYRDANADGVADGSSIGNVTTTTTGRYRFDGLCPGSYVVNFGTLNGFARTLQLNLINGDFGDSDPNPVTGYTNTITLVNQSDLTNDAGYYSVTILPVSFGTISAQGRNCEVALSFEVLTQKNTKQFEIQSSKDGSKWDNIGVVSAKASNATAYTYSSTHTAPAVGVNLYRIKVVDNDGKISYSQIASATSVCTGKGQITAYPNPAYEMLNVSLPTTYQDAQVQLFNGMGQMVVNDAKKSGLVRSLNTQNLTPGIYLLKVIYNNNVVMTQKVVKGE